MIDANPYAPSDVVGDLLTCERVPTAGKRTGKRRRGAGPILPSPVRAASGRPKVERAFRPTDSVRVHTRAGPRTPPRTTEGTTRIGIAPRGGEEGRSRRARGTVDSIPRRVDRRVDRADCTLRVRLRFQRRCRPRRSLTVFDDPPRGERVTSMW